MAKIHYDKDEMKLESIASRVWRAVTGFFERIIIVLLAGTVILLWILQTIPQQIIPFETALGASMALVVIMLWLIASRIGEPKPEPKPKITFDPGSGKANNEIVNFIKSEGAQEPASPQVAKLTEYSSYTVEPILRELVRYGWRINLLIFNPLSEEVLSKFQKDQRICFMIKRLRGAGFLGAYERAKIRCYEGQASIRGRKLANKLIQIGWYTYEQREEAKKDMGDNQIWGHDNPLMSAPVASAEGRSLEPMFDRVWQDFWDNRSLAIKEVCGSCSKKAECLGDGADDWLDRVSP